VLPDVLFFNHFHRQLKKKKNQSKSPSLKMFENYDDLNDE